MFHRRKHVELITDAQRSPVEDWHRRRREYAVLQGSRIPFLLLAALAYMLLHNLVLAAIFTVISVPLPWIAVVIANAVGETQDPRKPQVYKPAANRNAYYAFNGLVDGERARELIAGSGQAASHESDESEASVDSRTTTVDVDPHSGNVMDDKVMSSGEDSTDSVNSADPDTTM